MGDEGSSPPSHARVATWTPRKEKVWREK